MGRAERFGDEVVCDGWLLTTGDPGTGFRNGTRQRGFKRGWFIQCREQLMKERRRDGGAARGREIFSSPPSGGGADIVADRDLTKARRQLDVALKVGM